MKMMRIFILAIAVTFGVLGSGCSSTDTDEHGVIRSDEGWF